MKILIRKFDGIWKRDRAPHAVPAPAPNGTRERRHPFSVSRLDSRHVMVERCAPSVLSWLKPRPAKHGDTSIAAVRRAGTGLAAPRHLCSAQAAHTTPYPKQISVPRHAYRTVARIASGVDAVRARFGVCAVVFVAAQAKRTQRQLQPLPPFATAKDGAPGNAGATAEGEEGGSRNNEDNARTGRAGAWVRPSRNVCRPGRWPPGREGCGRAGRAA